MATVSRLLLLAALLCGLAHAGTTSFNMTTYDSQTATVTTFSDGRLAIITVTLNTPGVAWVALGFGSTVSPTGITMTGTDIVMGIPSASLTDAGCVRSLYIAPTSNPALGPNDAPTLVISSTTVSRTSTTATFGFTRFLSGGHNPMVSGALFPFLLAYSNAATAPSCTGIVDPSFIHNGTATQYVQLP